MQRMNMEQLSFTTEGRCKEMKIRKKEIVTEDQRMRNQLMSNQDTRRNRKLYTSNNQRLWKIKLSSAKERTLYAEVTLFQENQLQQAHSFEDDGKGGGNNGRDIK